MKIFLGSDHRGFHLKEKIAKWLFENKYHFEDLGADHLDSKDDYTKYAERVASIISTSSSLSLRGILLCGSGVGVDVVANKFDGVRAGIGKSVNQVKAGRKDDDMNVLVIAADYTGEEEAIEMVKAFLGTEFDKKGRRVRRLQEIERIEENN
jgi:ribose 5-phosphate isomerase B